MKISCSLLLVSFLCYCGCSSHKPGRAVPANLRCEYLMNPQGIDVKQPRLSWEVRSDERAQRQSAYRILVASDSMMLAGDKADVWDSKTVRSDQAGQIVYTGKALKPGTRYFWKAKVWDATKKASAWSAIASWSTGLPEKGEWKAEWIGAAPENIPVESRFYSNFGFQSDFSKSAESTKHVVVDLGTAEELTEIRLHPTLFGNAPGGYLFPVRFRIEVSASEDFAGAKVVADETTKDHLHNVPEPYASSFAPITARYVRLTVSKLAPADTSGYAFSLAELEALDAKKTNLALKKEVIASDARIHLRPFSYENWLPAKLTDGFLKPNPWATYQLPVPPSPLLRKTFTVDKKVKSAFLHASALGLYEVRINGKKVGRQVLAPEWTDYHTRVQYQTYDVTSLLQSGANVMGAMLADGWYAGAVFSHPERGTYGFDRRFFGQLAVQYEDGSTDLVVTDRSWKIREEGPITMASIFNGETFDARLIPAGWEKPGFDDSSWKNVTVDKSVSIALSAQMNEPIAVVGEIVPVGISEVGNGTYIVDMGQNIAGWVRLQLPYNPGSTITLRHGEVLDEQGKLYTANLRAAKQVDTYIPGNETTVVFEPRFTYHGFRYVEISGLTRKPEPAHITGIVVASASPVAGSFETSSADLNKLWENILWTQRGNMHSTPTDCPQRDERAGWMGDAQVFSQTAIFNLDMAAFLTKWVRDIRDSQSFGRFPDYAPHTGVWGNFYNSPGWGDSGVITPWRMYENYGDLTVLSDHYPAMKDFIQSIHIHNPDLLWRKARGNIYGDWLNGNTIKADDYPKDGGQVPPDVYATAFFAYSTRIVAKVAQLLEKKEDATYYDSLATAIRQAFVTSYVSADGKIKGDTQAGYALALDFDLVPGELRKKAAGHMVDAIKAYDYRISTGIQTTIRLMNQLSVFGYDDVAYRLLESHRFPSWLYSVDQGATTIWERWDGYVKGRGFQSANMNSFNHYAIGAVGEWMYRSILGINPDLPGYKSFIVHPRPGGSLTWAKGTYHSMAGKIAVSWTTSADTFTLEVEVPANTTATVVLPPGKAVRESGREIREAVGVKVLSATGPENRLSVQSGRYTFEVKR